MEFSVKHRMEMVALPAKGDAEYSRMLKELKSLERKYEGGTAGIIHRADGCCV